MSKKKHRREQQMGATTLAPAGASTTAGSTSSSLVAPAAAPVAELEKVAQAQGVIVPQVPVVPTPAESEELLRRRLGALIAGYAEAQKKVDEREETVLTLETELQGKKQANDDAAARAAAEQARLRALQQEHEARMRDLVVREERVRGLEAQAEAGFLQRRAELLAPLEQALAEHRRSAADLMREEHEHRTGLDARRREAEEDLDRRRTSVEAELQQRRQALEDEYHRRDADLAAREANLREQEGTVTKDRRRLTWTERDLQDREAHLAEHIEGALQERAAEVARERDVARARADDLGRRLTELEREREREREAFALLGRRGPEEIRTQIHGLQEEVARLKDQLADRPSADLQAEVVALRAERERWDTERRTLQEQRRELEQRTERMKISVTQVEDLRDVIRGLEAGRKLHEEALRQLERDVDERLSKRGDQPAFPELTKIEIDPDLNRPCTRSSEAVKLDQIASNVRQWLAARQPALFYREEDIRAFLGGLAMSRLHLLQGISGIGKSSLPRAFAAEVGGECYTVSVQAGWRDKNDLFGHYNTFERRYHETAFVQALFRAGRDALKDRIVFVLLDEMNLSHPEQYAADVLDVLERTSPAERRFELNSFELKGPKDLEDGRFLKLPENVWFVGTANHDETTKDFADKTYDRSFVLELPSTVPAAFPPQPPRRTAPLSLTALEKAFEQASVKHRSVTADGEQWLRETLGKPLSERLRIGLAGRLGKQLSRFVPVVIDAGGSLGEALDQVVTTRLLRKLAGRHDTQVEDVEHIQTVIGKTWPCKKTPASSALRLLDAELKRLRG